MSSAFIGKRFYDKAYTLANPGHYQHRGKGRWYLVDDADAAIPPPQQRLLQMKAKQGTTIKKDPEIPKASKEPGPVRKRPAAAMDEHIELMETRTRKGSAREIAIDVDEATKASELKKPTRATKRLKTPATIAAVEGDGDEIAVAAFNPIPPKSPTKKKTNPRQKKKAPAAPKPRIVPTAARGMRYTLVAPKGLSEDHTLQSELKSDLEAMGLSTKALGKRKAGSPIDNATQIVGTNFRKSDELEARTERFGKKQSANAEARANGSAKEPTADGAGDTPILVEDEGMSSNWVLFEPRHGFPPKFGTPPKVFEQLQYYQPGNKRIVAYNTVSFSVHIRKTPVSFGDREVQYTNRGVRLVRMRRQRSLGAADEEAEAS